MVGTISIMHNAILKNLEIEKGHGAMRKCNHIFGVTKKAKEILKKKGCLMCKEEMQQQKKRDAIIGFIQVANTKELDDIIFFIGKSLNW